VSPSFPNPAHVAAVVATSVGEVIDAVFLALLWLQWNTPIGVIVCIALGVLTARKTQRSIFNWVLVGAINGIIPVVGPILMVVAYFFYPPPAPSSRRGYHPPGSGGRRTGGAGSSSTKRRGGGPRDRR
jgi:hypothetical protein